METNELTQVWLEEEALHGDEDLIVVIRCDWAGHGECEGRLYQLVGSNLVSCHRHIVLHDLWRATPPEKDFSDWLDDLDNQTARIMYDTHKETTRLSYWKQMPIS